MASKTPSADARSRSKHLPDKTDKEGMCLKVVCKVLTLRMLLYILKQPPSFLFILTLFVIAVCLPFVGLYIKGDRVLPDLDAMQNWNAYIGKLGEIDKCFQVEPEDTTSNSPFKYPPFQNASSVNNSVLLSTGVMLDFDVSSSVVGKGNEVATTVLVGEINGTEIGTQIKDAQEGERIDGNIFVHFWLPISANTTNCTLEKSVCHVSGCVLITAPSTAIPTRLPQVHEDFTFRTKVFDCKASSRCPTNTCSKSVFDFNKTLPVQTMKLSSDCSWKKHQVQVNDGHKSVTKGHGVIHINLKSADQSVAAHHMYLAAVVILALGLIFTAGILLTDRPSEPKPSTA